VISSRTLLSVVLACLVLVAGAGAWAWWQRPVAEPLPVYGTVPDFSLSERSGRTITRAALLGKVSVVDFFYTRCPDVCPLQSAHLARLQRELAGVPDAQLLSITVDPDHDTPAVLSAYAQRFDADPARWLFLTGPRAAIYRLAVDGFGLAAIVSQRRVRDGTGGSWLRPASAWAHDEPGGPRIIQLVHASRFALVDRQTQLRGYFDGTDWAEVARMEKELRRLLDQAPPR
jgi:protein SCO1/2